MRFGQGLIPACIGLAGIALVAGARPHVAADAKAVKERSDSYALPPPGLLITVSMGYRAALADMIWAHVLVTQGLRMTENRPFDYVATYLDAVGALDPNFREPYRLADSLLSFQSNDPDRDRSAREARRIMERGLELRPHDADLWLSYGQFMSYLAPGMLKNVREREAWQKLGIKALVTAGELGSTDEFLYWKSLSAAGALTRDGEQEAALSFMARLYSMTEDPGLREQLEGRISALNQGKLELEGYRATREFERVWRERYPFVPRSLVSVMGPPVDTWKCAGAQRDEDQRDACARNWTGWRTHLLRLHAGSDGR